MIIYFSKIPVIKIKKLFQTSISNFTDYLLLPTFSYYR